jgi:L-ribulose-5-phosphate 3-epimerase
MQIDGHDLGVCSWSLQPEDLAELVQKVTALGLSHVHLALRPLLFLDDKRKFEQLGHLRGSGVTVTAGMIHFPGEDYSTIARIRTTGGLVPDDVWPLRKQLVIQAGKLAQEMGISLLSFHAGFLPRSSHNDYPKLLSRVGDLAAAVEPMGVSLLLESGQESASELLQFLNDLPGVKVGVNLDPANLILYGTDDPIEAVHILGRHIRHVHIKDAIAAERPGLEWGREVAVGTGQVDMNELLLALREIGYTGPLAIEREAGADTVKDIRAAIEILSAASQR